MHIAFPFVVLFYCSLIVFFVPPFIVRFNSGQCCVDERGILHAYSRRDLV